MDLIGIAVLIISWEAWVWYSNRQHMRRLIKELEEKYRNTKPDIN